jgi:hypothetical protein
VSEITKPWLIIFHFPDEKTPTIFHLISNIYLASFCFRLDKSSKAPPFTTNIPSPNQSRQQKRMMLENPPKNNFCQFIFTTARDDFPFLFAFPKRKHPLLLNGG